MHVNSCIDKLAEILKEQADAECKIDKDDDQEDDTRNSRLKVDVLGPHDIKVIFATLMENGCTNLYYDDGTGNFSYRGKEFEIQGGPGSLTIRAR